MKEKFAEGPYVQDRAHVFVTHFGVKTLTYTLSKPKKVKNWKMSKESPSFKTAYILTVIQTYKSKYGNFDIHQNVILVKENGGWEIMWDYKS